MEDNSTNRNPEMFPEQPSGPPAQATPTPEQEHGPVPQKTNLKKPLLILASILLGILLISVGCNQLAKQMTGILGISDTGGSSFYSEYSSVRGEHVVVLYIEGVITSGESGGLLSGPSGYNHQFLLDTIDEAMYREDNKGLMLYVNSPGGGVYESDELYLKIMEYKQTTGNPVYVYMGSMAASGGYYISAPADMIYANRNCWTGSIGVTMGTFYDITGLLEKYGVKTVTITAGNNKAMGSYTDPLTPEQEAIFQSLVDEAYDQFVTIVAQGRNMKKADVIRLADGRIYTAAQAKASGLIDEIGTFDEAIGAMSQKEGLENSDFIPVAPPQPTWLEQLLSEAGAIARSRGEVSSILEAMYANGNMPIAYLCTFPK